jgi:hypothetical protein
MILDRAWFTGLGYEKCVHAGTCLAQFGRDGDVTLLDDVVALTTSADSEAVAPAGLSASHFLRGTALRARYDVHGSLDDLQWALRAMRQATEEDPRQDRGYRLQLLAETLLIVIERLAPGEAPVASHLQLAEQWIREAWELSSTDERARRLSDLGLTLLQRFRHFGSAHHWDAAVDQLIEARDAATNQTDLAACWGNLGKAFLTRYSVEKDPEVAALALSAYERAASIGPPSDPSFDIHRRHVTMVRQMFGLDEVNPS